MSKKAHTPGPWREGVDGNTRVYGPDGMGEHSGIVADVFKGRANARLIAAAPEMLEALEAIIESKALEFATTNQSPPGAYDVLISKIDAALSKATGGE